MVRAAAAPATLGEAVERVAASLGESGVETPRVDAELLAAHVFGVTRSALAARTREPLPDGAWDDLATLARRRATREPLQHVLGEWGFRRLTLTVDRRALIPRPETETLVERALALLLHRETPAVLDVGTGSGAIALAIADEHPGAQVTGLDVDDDALALARENAARCGLPVAFVQGDLFAGLPPGPWHVVVSNPPYVPLADRDALPPEVRDWEPARALHATGAVEAVAATALPVLVPGGALVVEVGDGQTPETAALLERLGYEEVAVTRDLAGRERVVEGVKRAAGG